MSASTTTTPSAADETIFNARAFFRTFRPDTLDVFARFRVCQGLMDFARELRLAGVADVLGTMQATLGLLLEELGVRDLLPDAVTSDAGGQLVGAVLQALEAKAQAEREEAVRASTLGVSSANVQTLPSPLELQPRLLDRFVDDLARAGVVGEERLAKTTYLAATSRLLERPVNVAVKGPSSAGKSYTVERTLEFFPPSAYYALSAMSERALAYSKEPLKHRMLVIYEAAGMSGDFASYLLRSLLSEGRLRYETVIKTKNGMEARLIEREGPTGLIVTTTALRLHPENETRLLSLLATDSRHQTKAVMRQLAKGSAAVDLKPWHRLQEGLQHLSTPVQTHIPYAEALAELIPPVAVRLRRDFGAVLSLIRAHAVLHHRSRERRNGAIVATLYDYAVVRELVADLVAEGVEATVPATVRETVEAVHGLPAPVTITALAAALKLDPSATWRRVQRALGRGYLVNEETRKSYPARLVLGEPPPKDLVILPDPEDPRFIGVCTFAEPTEGDKTEPKNDAGSHDAHPRVGDVLKNGRRVLEVDAHGPVVVAKAKAAPEAADLEVIP